MAGSSSCGLCRRLQRSFEVRQLGTTICASCAKQIGRFVLASDDAGLRKVWKLPIAAPSEPRSPLTPSRPPAKGDAEVHGDLALAYREMGLFTDALLEAARALESKEPYMPALEVVFSPQIRSAGILEKLRTKLFPE